MKIMENVPLAPFTTFKVGGSSRFYCKPTNIEEVKQALLFVQNHNIPFFSMGGGSNLLVNDTGYKGLVLHLTEFNHINFTGEEAHAESGVAAAALARKAAEAGLSGLEFAGGLPGSLGGAVYMNARAYGGSFQDVVTSVTVVTRDGIEKNIPAIDLNFSYKYSSLMDSGDLLISVHLQLTSGDRESIIATTEKNLHKRKDMGQFTFPNAGCVFKNDYELGIPSGKVIDELGLLGKQMGGAAVYEKHGNFIINRDNASAADVKALIDFIKQTALEKRNIRLEEEIRYLGFDD